jgi:predicted nucleotidyltransferase
MRSSLGAQAKSLIADTCEPSFWDSKVTHPVFRDQDALAAICRRHQIHRLSLFGSTLKGSDRPDSDVDLLVEFQPEARPAS